MIELDDHLLSLSLKNEKKTHEFLLSIIRAFRNSGDLAWSIEYIKRFLNIYPQNSQYCDINIKLGTIYMEKKILMKQKINSIKL